MFPMQILFDVLMLEMIGSRYWSAMLNRLLRLGQEERMLLPISHICQRLGVRVALMTCFFFCFYFCFLCKLLLFYEDAPVCQENPRYLGR